MQRPELSQPGASQANIALQFFLSHLIAGAIALAAFFGVTQWSLPQPYALLCAIITGAIVGLLLSAHVQYSLYLADLALARFTQGLTVETLRTLWRWPLNSLFVSINVLSQRIKEYADHERLTLEWREQVLHQAGEAAAQEERNRIARDLHDSIKQQIFSISMSAAAAKAHMGGDEVSARDAVEDIQRSTKEAQIEMSALLQQLRSSPLENTNLREALQTQAQALGYRTGAHVQIEIADLPFSDRLLPGAQETIFRMVQEAFANIARHARANTIWLNVSQHDHALDIEIRDDGQGFDLEAVRKGMGLKNLYDRATSLQGHLTIQSSPSQGTTIHAHIPLLDALPTAEERERARLELKRAIDQASWGYQLAETAMPLALVFVVISSPLFVIALALAAALYGYFQGAYYRTRVTLAAKDSLDYRVLLRRDISVRLFLLGFLLFSTWYTFITLSLLQQPFSIWLLLGFSLVLGALTLLVVRQRYHIVEQLYQYMEPSVLAWELEQNRRGILRRGRLWILATASALVFGRFAIVFPPLTPRTWIAYGIILALLAWGVMIVIEFLQIRRWRRKSAPLKP
jgi:signal transduction histidine kinase